MPGAEACCRDLCGGQLPAGNIRGEKSDIKLFHGEIS